MLLSVSNVAKAFGVDQILTGVTFRMEAREKVALVGRNGTGKTTLLKILTGQYEPDSGAVQLAKGAKIGYLRQEALVATDRTVLEEAEEAVKRQLTLQARLNELEDLMHADEATPEDLEEYALLHEHFLEAEGYSAERDLRVVLQKMGFTEGEFSKPTSKLSGGETTRLAIARLLLEEPDLLILDEPTNHLDLQATEWLESWLRGYHGAVLLVSHDRAFLDNTAERVLDMRDGTVKSYPGPFPKYMQLRAEEEARQAEVARRQDMEIAKMDEYVRRFMNSQRTAQARGRLKLMNRLIETKVEAPKHERGMKAGFSDVKRSGDIALDTDRLTVGFVDPGNERTILFSDLDWSVRFGDRWGIIGENGSGKSTLIKVLLGEIEPLSGRTRLGSNVSAGYFSQDASDLDPDMSPLDTMVWDLDMQPPDARNLLARFLITGDDVYRPIKTLSGGEKNKLSLAKLTQMNPNLLILDEPTNHLDMASREALAGVLRDYKGSLLLVSHDRWLLSEVTDHTMDIRRSGVVLYPGSYTEYRNRSTKPVSAKKAAVSPSAKMPEKVEEPSLTPRELSKEIERMTKVVTEIEAEIEADEAALKDLEGQLANLEPTADVFTLTRDHQRLQEQLESRLAAWQEQSERLDKLSALRG
ncbi:MAG: ABC-F family ATP-binding cassette domain-containing protein [Fimbriimonas sp.]|nr:ABC-F family ATP-binding cassette domain-containing protein [Fimbriimonas sp.]